MPILSGTQLCVSVILVTLLAAACQSPPSPAPVTAPVIEGEVPGLWYWQLPDTPNGLRPTNSWSGAGSAPNGDIYIAGMDHSSNSALYRLHDGTLTYLGDARSASTAAGNWQAGETAQKFHTHPTWFGGNLYVATLPHSDLNDGYLDKRGFHWYRFNASAATFTDLSAGIGDGTGIAHGGPMSIAVDPSHNAIYGAINPTGQIVRLDLATDVTEVLGRPDYQREYVYPGRWMWVDSKGRLYFTTGNTLLRYYGGEYDPTIFNHVRYFDPTAGFGERADWQLHDQRAIDTGQCFPSVGVCYLCDNVGHIYRFTEAGPTWTYLGSIGQSDLSTNGFVWVFHVRADQSRAYIIANSGDFFEFDLTTGRATHIANIKTVAPTLQPMKWLYGHDAWDRQGRFFFAAFTQDTKTGPNVLLTAIDPDIFKAAIAASQ